MKDGQNHIVLWLLCKVMLWFDKHLEDVVASHIYNSGSVWPRLHHFMHERRIRRLISGLIHSSDIPAVAILYIYKTGLYCYLIFSKLFITAPVLHWGKNQFRFYYLFCPMQITICLMMHSNPYAFSEQVSIDSLHIWATCWPMFRIIKFFWKILAL